MIQQVAISVLGLSCGFAGTVWFILAWANIRMKRWAAAFSYVSLVLVNVMATVLIVGMILNRPFLLPRGATTLLLIPLVLFPPALQLHAYLSSQRLVRQVMDDE